MKLRVVNVLGADVTQYAEALRTLERDIVYPLGDGKEHFYIDHGDEYHRFFAELGEDAGFLLAFDGDELVGTFAGVRRVARIGDREVPSLYLADYKIKKSHRGRGVGRAMVLQSLAMLRIPQLRTGRVFYGAAMRGARGDVMRSASGVKRLMRLMRPTATLAVYFVEPAKLASLDVNGAPPPPRGRGLDLSPDAPRLVRAPGIVETAGRKDLRLVSTHAPWPLHHLPIGPFDWHAGLARYLRACGEALAGDVAPCCFALDERLHDHVVWLRARGIEAGAACTVYALRLPPAHGAIDWVHIATSQI